MGVNLKACCTNLLYWLRQMAAEWSALNISRKKEVNKMEGPVLVSILVDYHQGWQSEPHLIRQKWNHNGG